MEEKVKNKLPSTKHRKNNFKPHNNLLQTSQTVFSQMDNSQAGPKLQALSKSPKTLNSLQNSQFLIKNRSSASPNSKRNVNREWLVKAIYNQGNILGSSSENSKLSKQTLANQFNILNAYKQNEILRNFSKYKCICSENLYDNGCLDSWMQNSLNHIQTISDQCKALGVHLSKNSLPGYANGFNSVKKNQILIEDACLLKQLEKLNIFATNKIENLSITYRVSTILLLKMIKEISLQIKFSQNEWDKFKMDTEKQMIEKQKTIYENDNNICSLKREIEKLKLREQKIELEKCNLNKTVSKLQQKVNGESKESNSANQEMLIKKIELLEQHIQYNLNSQETEHSQQENWAQKYRECQLEMQKQEIQFDKKLKLNQQEINEKDHKIILLEQSVEGLEKTQKQTVMELQVSQSEKQQQQLQMAQNTKLCQEVMNKFAGKKIIDTEEMEKLLESIEHVVLFLDPFFEISKVRQLSQQKQISQFPALLQNLTDHFKEQQAANEERIKQLEEIIVQKNDIGKQKRMSKKKSVSPIPSKTRLSNRNEFNFTAENSDTHAQQQQEKIRKSTLKHIEKQTFEAIAETTTKTTNNLLLKSSEVRAKSKTQYTATSQSSVDSLHSLDDSSTQIKSEIAATTFNNDSDKKVTGPRKASTNSRKKVQINTGNKEGVKTFNDLKRLSNSNNSQKSTEKQKFKKFSLKQRQLELPQIEKQNRKSVNRLQGADEEEQSKKENVVELFVSDEYQNKVVHVSNTGNNNNLSQVKVVKVINNQLK